MCDTYNENGEKRNRKELNYKFRKYWNIRRKKNYKNIGIVGVIFSNLLLTSSFDTQLLCCRFVTTCYVLVPYLCVISAFSFAIAYFFVPY